MYIKENFYAKLEQLREEQLDEAKKPKPLKMTRKQEEDKSIPNSLAAYRDRIYKARMKQLRSK